MKYFLGLIMAVTLSCKSEELSTTCYYETDPPRNNQKVTIEQGIWGDIWFWSGNFMPVGRGEICQVNRKIYIYELTTSNDAIQVSYTSFYSEINTILLTTVESSLDGFFQIELEPGDYSIFIEEDGNFYANNITSNGISNVLVESGKVSEVMFNITYKAVF